MESLFKDNLIIPSFSTFLLTLLLISSYIYLNNIYKYWQCRNIKGPKPILFIGNLYSLLFKDRTVNDIEWRKKYGKLFGIFKGTKPELVCSDIEVMHQICVRDFEYFTDHQTIPALHKYQQCFVFFQKGEHWKKIRALMSPTFTSGKIRKMFKFMDNCADDLIDCLSEQLRGDKKERIINVKELYSLFTLDAITNCCYGFKMQRADFGTNIKSLASRNDFVAISMRMLEINPLRFIISIIIPERILKWFKFSLTPDSQVMPVAQRVQQLIDSRRNNSSKQIDDYLQLLIDAKLDYDLHLHEMDLKENHHACLTHETLIDNQKRLVDEIKSNEEAKKKTILSDLEITSAAMFLMLVGLETSSSLLTSCSYSLAFHPEIQEKLFGELMQIARWSGKEKSKFEYEELTSCQYLDAVLAETLRRFPPVPFVDRVALQDYRIEKYNLTIPKGLVVNMAIYAINNDPDYWHEPEKFNPDRFLPTNKEKIVPGSYCPFGIGPRHCIGMRFSLTESKIALAKAVLNFRFKPAPQTEFPPKMKPDPFLFNLKDARVTLISRNR